MIRSSRQETGVLTISEHGFLQIDQRGEEVGQVEKFPLQVAMFDITMALLIDKSRLPSPICHHVIDPWLLIGRGAVSESD